MFYLQGLTSRKNKIARMKIQKVLIEEKFEDNTDNWVKFWVSGKMFPPEAVIQRCYKKVF